MSLYRKVRKVIYKFLPVTFIFQKLLQLVTNRKPKAGMWKAVAGFLVKRNVIIRKEYKNRFFVDLVDYYEPLRANGWYKHSEIETQNWIIDHVQRDWVIFDCGSHIGYYSMLFSYCAPGGRIYSFEANEEVIAKFSKNLAYNTAVFGRDFRNIELIKTALGDRICKELEEVLYFSGKPIPNHGQVKDKFNFITLDYFCQIRGIMRLDLIKSDIDSWDYELLLGAKETINRFRPIIIVEVNEELQKRNRSEEDVKQFLNEVNYVYQQLDYPSPTNWLMTPKERSQN